MQFVPVAVLETLESAGIGMGKDTLLHDADARNDEKVVVLRQQLGSEGYGNFWMLNELMKSATENKLLLSRSSAYAFSCAVPVTQFEQVIKVAIELGLYNSDGESFWSSRIVRDAAAYRQRCEINAQNASKGGATKRTLARRKANAKRSPSVPLYSPPLNSILEDGGCRGEETVRVADRITLSRAEYDKLLAEFGEDAVRFEAPVASDWLAANGRVKKDYAAFLRNWIRKDKAESKGFYTVKPGFYPSRREREIQTIKDQLAEARRNKTSLIEVKS